MKTSNKLPHTPTKANLAFIEYKQPLTWLLLHCYGLELNDTPYHDNQAIAQQIEQGITVRETVNELVDKFDLIRIDRPSFSLVAQDPRRIRRWVCEAEMEGMQARFNASPQTAVVRKQTVEHPFGTIKMWMGATHFLTQRFKNVSTEISLHVLTYN